MDFKASKLHTPFNKYRKHIYHLETPRFNEGSRTTDDLHLSSFQNITSIQHLM
jgi:hypothetical protein